MGGDNTYYEIEYDACPIPGVGKFVLKQQKIEPPTPDEQQEKRLELFRQMRDIANGLYSARDYSKFFDRRVQNDSARIFYKQGMFMKDYTDDCEESVPFSQYFPYYQMMGCKQLRTYFTWRTEVRKGNIADTSLSYAFLYIYELLDNIGVENPQDGLDRLTAFRRAFGRYSDSAEKYMRRWIKDYHIYYELPHSFKKYAEENGLKEDYPGLTDDADRFELLCAASKYDIRGSAFFCGGNEKLVTDCVNFVTDRLEKIFADNGMNFDDEIFNPTKKMADWKPFKGALFYPWVRQRDRRVVLSPGEIYICRNNRWTAGTAIASDGGRQLLGYIMKQAESELRKKVKYKFKLSANIKTVTHRAVARLEKTGMTLERIINTAVEDFYKEATRTVVKVDSEMLERIRQEALVTQSRLIVEDADGDTAISIGGIEGSTGGSDGDCSEAGYADTLTDAWAGLKEILTDIEKEALAALLKGEDGLAGIAAKHGIMPEVLADGINEKASDLTGDSLMDEEFVLYEDYTEQIKELVK